MDDAVARYRAASEANEIEALLATLDTEVELVSPICGRMVFRGLDDMRILLAAVYGGVSGLKWTEEVGDGSVRVVVGEGVVGRARFGDAMVFEAPDGRIARIRPHLRPWLALTLLALKLGLKVGRHPGLVLRAQAGLISGSDCAPSQPVRGGEGTLRPGSTPRPGSSVPRRAWR